MFRKTVFGHSINYFMLHKSLCVIHSGISLHTLKILIFRAVLNKRLKKELFDNFKTNLFNDPYWPYGLFIQYRNYRVCADYHALHPVREIHKSV